MSRILITGGAGFIGSHVTDRMLRMGHEVAVIDNLVSGSLDNLAQARDGYRGPHRVGGGRGLQIIECDITSADASTAVEWFAPEYICHLAAQIDVRRSVDDPLHDAEINLLGTLRLLEAAQQAGTRKFIFATSGGCIYGEPPLSELPVGEAYPVGPHSPYGASKYAAEVYLGTYARLYGLPWTSLALSNVYGPRQRADGEAGVVAIFGSRMLNRETVTIYGDGLQSRDFVYVADVADAFVAAMDAGDNMRFNIGTGVRSNLIELFDQLALLTGYHQKPVHDTARLGELRHSALDPALADAELAWQPRTALADGLAQTVAWLKSHQQEHALT